eukprot:TRINITY_DN247_c0_g1_i2.p1 TRINITY_DN247_c0_g1~~TRINITY_DN247_c0_g1_i2.p1  ORF type:complete len:222 (-),score=23.36 TRINITY_DN247_c0_g1_i2:12-677(-)
MDCGAKAVATQSVNAIVSRFGESTRAQRLRGMYNEFRGQLDTAEKIYKDILEQYPSNQMAQKRLVGLLKSQGKFPTAIEELVKYLDMNGADKEGWEELADLYVRSGMFKQAAYCFEELIMLAPHYSNYYIRYADALYSVGGQDNVSMAKKYYCKAITLAAGKSLRALLGLSLCLNQEISKGDNGEMRGLIKQNVQKLFKQSFQQDKLEALLSVLDDLIPEN